MITQYDKKKMTNTKPIHKNHCIGKGTHGKMQLESLFNSYNNLNVHSHLSLMYIYLKS